MSIMRIKEINMIDQRFKYLEQKKTTLKRKKQLLEWARLSVGEGFEEQLSKKQGNRPPEILNEIDFLKKVKD